MRPQGFNYKLSEHLMVTSIRKHAYISELINHK